MVPALGRSLSSRFPSREVRLLVVLLQLRATRGRTTTTFDGGGTTTTLAENATEGEDESSGESGSLSEFCEFGPWSDWTTCACDPGGGSQERQRDVNALLSLESWNMVTANCVPWTQEQRSCNLFCPLSAPVDCLYGAWGPWSGCSAECGEGQMQRWRRVERQASGGGQPCAGTESEMQSCSSALCQIFVIWMVVVLIAMMACGSYFVWVARRRRLKHRVVPVVRDEEEELPTHLNTIAVAPLPSYWSNKLRDGDFHELMYMSTPGAHAIFNELLDHSYLPRCTQDRPCPNVPPCARRHFGCPCVQPGPGQRPPGLPTGYVLHRLIRVESARTWQRYARRRAEILSQRQDDEGWKIDPPLLSDHLIRSHPEFFEPLQASINEVYAWHGTSIRKALRIAREDYRLDLAGSGAGGMYGSGMYLAESCTKADEYARDEAEGCYKGVFAMLLSRVCMGSPFYTTERNDTAQHVVKNGAFDSTFGDREKSVGTFRELVVYNTDQVYPEYILLYRRVHRGDDAVQVVGHLKEQLHTELPVYWRNCYRDPRTEDFVEQYRVRMATLRLLQRLVNKSVAAEGVGFEDAEPPRELRVVQARRVENSRIWRRYINFKTRLKQKLRENGKTLDSEQVLTAQLLRSNSFRAQAVSCEHFEHSLNEHLLWHGTSAANAEQIATNDFWLPSDFEVEHGARFGRGIYFAESLQKSVHYAPAKQGIHTVLLCRVACGECFHTELGEDLRAVAQARASGLNTVLAHPGGCGPREFVALMEEQAYPEYIVDLAEIVPATPQAPAGRPREEEAPQQQLSASGFDTPSGSPASDFASSDHPEDLFPTNSFSDTPRTPEASDGVARLNAPASPERLIPPPLPPEAAPVYLQTA